jgi:hypothetical protein
MRHNIALVIFLLCASARVPTALAAEDLKLNLLFWDQTSPGALPSPKLHEVELGQGFDPAVFKTHQKLVTIPPKRQPTDFHVIRSHVLHKQGSLDVNNDRVSAGLSLAYGTPGANAALNATFFKQILRENRSDHADFHSYVYIECARQEITQRQLIAALLAANVNPDNQTGPFFVSQLVYGIVIDIDARFDASSASTRVLQNAAIAASGEYGTGKAQANFDRQRNNLDQNASAACTLTIKVLGNATKGIVRTPTTLQAFSAAVAEADQFVADVQAQVDPNSMQCTANRGLTPAQKAAQGVDPQSGILLAVLQNLVALRCTLDPWQAGNNPPAGEAVLRPYLSEYLETDRLESLTSSLANQSVGDANAVAYSQLSQQLAKHKREIKATAMAAMKGLGNLNNIPNAQELMRWEPNPTMPNWTKALKPDATPQGRRPTLLEIQMPMVKLKFEASKVVFTKPNKDAAILNSATCWLELKDKNSQGVSAKESQSQLRVIQLGRTGTTSVFTTTSQGESNNLDLNLNADPLVIHVAFATDVNGQKVGFGFRGGNDFKVPHDEINMLQIISESHDDGNWTYLCPSVHSFAPNVGGPNFDYQLEYKFHYVIVPR